MKKLFLILIAFFLLGCPYDPFDMSFREENTEYEPLLMERDELEKSVRVDDALELQNPGKIYLWQQYLFVAELYKGVHVFDNSNPASPQNLYFITAPGCVDMSVKQGYLYIDNATDLVTIDILNINDIKVVKRIKEVFPELLPPDSDFIPSKYDISNRPQNTVIVEWRKKL